MRWRITLSIVLVAICASPGISRAQPMDPRALLESAAEAMGGLERLRKLDNVALTGFGVYASQQGGGNLSPDPRAPSKWQTGHDLQRTFDLQNERALLRERRGSLFPFAAQSAYGGNRADRTQTGIAILDHPLTAVLEALDPETRIAGVRVEAGLAVVEFTIEQGSTLWIALDARSRLPAWVRWISGSPTLGDVTNTAYFTGYLPHDGIELPTGITTTIDWRNTTTAMLQVDSYKINAEDAPAIPAAASGAPPVPQAAQSRQVAPGVWDVRVGGDGGAVIEFADHLTMFEAYNNEASTFARLDLANTLVPGKQVTEVIVSHHHFDHSGGLRAAVARGLTVISRRGNEGIFREMVARPAPNFPDALARNPQPLKFVPVDRQLTLDDGTMRVDVYHAIGHLHMAEAVFAYVPAHRIFLEGDFTTHDWDFNWWGGAYLENIERYGLDPAINIPVHGIVTTFDETIDAIERQVDNARKLCADSARSGTHLAGCPVQYAR
jgi:glyoxylase-like metal-dependent hydrolase (beta-lactamase superfamily II)